MAGKEGRQKKKKKKRKTTGNMGGTRTLETLKYEGILWRETIAMSEAGRKEQ